MKKIRIGVFGLYRGTSMINYCMAATHAQVVAICDKWEEGIARKKEQLQDDSITFYTSFDEFIKHDMDAVVLANYANEHAPFAIRCMKAGKHVFSEVLPVQTMREAVELVECVEQTGPSTAPCTPLAARCSGVADSASLHVLTPPAASRPSTTTACFTPQLAIVVLQRCRLQASFAHWTFASPVSRTARGEVPSHWPRHLFYPPTQGSLLSRTTQHGGLFLASLGMYAYGRLAHPLRPFCAPSIPAVY